MLCVKCYGKHSVPALIRRCDDLPATITHVPVVAVLVFKYSWWWALAPETCSDSAEIKPAQCCIKLVFHLTAMCSFIFNLITQIIGNLMQCGIIKLLIMQFSPVDSFIPSKHQYLSQYPTTNIHIQCFFLNVSEKFHSHVKHYFSLSRPFQTTVSVRDSV